MDNEKETQKNNTIDSLYKRKEELANKINNFTIIIDNFIAK